MPDPRIGLDFGDYKVTRKIAEGGMGAVYLAEHSSGMRKVVKFMLGEALRIPAIRKRFENECLAAKRLKGRSGIVEIDSFGERNGEMYLVMEYIDGYTLEEHIRRSVRLTAHHTYHVMLLMLRALDVLHAEGIIHRDLKPSNVFLRHTDERPYDPTLIDFGIVHDKQAMNTAEFGTREGQMIGTPGFMATEQFGQAHMATPATDVFACAVIMWLMLTGDLPWGIADTEFAQYDRQLNHRPIWPAHIPLPYAEGWKELLVEALSPDPARRPQSAQLFALLLAQRLEGIPPHVPNGLAMVEKLAPKFLRNLPAEVETVRSPDGRIEVASFWSPRTGGATPVSSGSFNFDAIRVSAVAAAPAATAPTVDARPHASMPVSQHSVPGAPASPNTTLSAASGIASPPSARSMSATRVAALTLVAALAIGGVTFGVSRLASHSSDTAESVEPASGTSGSQAVGSSDEPTNYASGSASPSPTNTVGTSSTPTQGATSGSAVVNTAGPVAPTGNTVDAMPAKEADVDATTEPAHVATTQRKNTSTSATSSHPRKNTSSKRVDTSTKTTSKIDHAAPDTATHSRPTNGAGSATTPRTGSATFDPDAIKE